MAVDHPMMIAYRILYLTSIVAAVFCALAIWFAHPDLVVIGRDGRLSLWLIDQWTTWSSPLAMSALNPYQGAGSTLLTVNGWWIPGAWPALAQLPAARILSMLVYLAEFGAAMWVLARSLGCGHGGALLAAISASVLLFPPFNFLFGLQGWLATAPFYGHSLALIALCYASLLHVGRSPIATAAGIIGLCGFIFWALMSAPFWNAGLMIGTAIGLSLITLASCDLRELTWRMAAGCVIVAGAVGSGMLGFLMATRDYSVRFIEEEARGGMIDWQAFGDGRQILSGLCNSGVACFSTPWPVPVFIPTAIVHGLLLAGCVAAILMGPQSLRRLGIAVGSAWLVLLAYWVAVADGVLATSSFSMIYWYLPLYPLLTAVAVAGARTVCIRFIGVPSVFVAVTVTLAAIAIAATYGRWPSLQPRPAPRLTAEAAAAMEYLQATTALEPGTPFEGSVATVLTSADDDPRLESGLADIERQTGSSFALLDLWERGIPTLEEYGQAITPALKFYERTFLQGNARKLSPHFVLVREPNVPVLESLGVRFIVTDGELPDVALRKRVPLETGELKVYELPQPNLGGWSMSTMEGHLSPAAIAARLRADPLILRDTALLSGEVPAVDLAQPSAVDLRFIKGGATLSVRTEGASALLLPLQFSHCLSATASRGELLAVERANMIHTLVLVSGDTDLTLRWRYGPLRGYSCRKMDIEDARRAGI